jgi:DNA polymerase-3 subunit delta'
MNTAAASAEPVPLTVGDDGALPLPWLAAPLAQALARWRSHALLLHGRPGSGTLQTALVLAQAWLCEAPREAVGSSAALAPPCGRCASCHLVHARLHPDLWVLLPQAQRRALGWPLRDDKLEQGEKKPSRQLLIDEVRQLIDWTVLTRSRGRGKVAVLHPAETLNAAAASALLKTLEEPPPGTRLILTTADPAWLLPTLLSRCQRVAVPVPPASIATTWLAARGVAQPEVLLAAAGSAPLDALALHADGVDAAAWARLPAAVAAGQGAALAGWPVPRAVDALQKLCVDATAAAAAPGAAPRHFPPGSLPPVAAAALPALLAWAGQLARVARHDDHPWNEPLLLDALVAQGRAALGTGRAAGGSARAGGVATLPR